MLKKTEHSKMCLIRVCVCRIDKRLDAGQTISLASKKTLSDILEVFIPPEIVSILVRI